KNKQLVLITTSFFTGCCYKQPNEVQIWTVGTNIKQQLNQRFANAHFGTFALLPAHYSLPFSLGIGVTLPDRKMQKSQNFPTAHPTY
ncbi:MAG: hypothetical protein LC111_14530, partial [Bacteroidia bacterium]|nr:hypothetical protein [Bacteroidia bacterium]